MSQQPPWITQTCSPRLKWSGTLNDRAGLNWRGQFHCMTPSAQIRQIEPITQQRIGSRKPRLRAQRRPLEQRIRFRAPTSGRVCAMLALLQIPDRSQAGSEASEMMCTARSGKQIELREALRQRPPVRIPREVLPEAPRCRGPACPRLTRLPATHGTLRSACAGDRP